MAGGVPDVGPDVIGLAGGEVDLKVFAIGVLDVAVDDAGVSGHLDLTATCYDAAGRGAVGVVAEEDVAVHVEAAVFGVGAVVAVAVAEP